MRMRKTPVILLLFLVIVVLAFAFLPKKQEEVQNANPEPTAPVTDIEVVQPAQKDDLIVLDSPLPGSTITSPLTITGKARGNWFFEATFPVILTDWDGLIIAEGYAEAQGEWMTTEYVPFVAKLTFTKPNTAVSTRGSLILKKANASGEPRFDNALEIWVEFEK